jgi:hypothetical protein
MIDKLTKILPCGRKLQATLAELLAKMKEEFLIHSDEEQKIFMADLQQAVRLCIIQAYAYLELVNRRRRKQRLAPLKFPANFKLKLSYDGRVIKLGRDHPTVLFGVSVCDIEGIPNSPRFTVPIAILEGEEKIEVIRAVGDKLR